MRIGPVAWLCVLVPLMAADAETFTPPAGAGHLSVTDFGANGADTLDDTRAFTDAVALWFDPDNPTLVCGGRPNNFRTLYLPNGTYIVSNTISIQRWTRMLGQSQSGTVIKLKANCPGYQDSRNARAVLHAHFPGGCTAYDGGNNSSFANYIENLTVLVGSGNPGAIGIRYNNHNEGAMRDVTIRSEDRAGTIGLDLTETEFGPGLLKNVTVDGFDRGIVTVASVSHATFENITLLRQNTAGMVNSMPVSIYRITSTNAVPAVLNTDFYLAHLLLIDADLGGSGAYAIENLGGACLRNIRTTGYTQALRGQSGTTIDEYFSSAPRTLFASPSGHVKLPLASPREPSDVQTWTVVSDVDGDDTRRIQDALNSGSANIMLKFGGSYSITSTLTVPPGVRWICGMSWGIHGEPSAFPPGTPLVRVTASSAEQLTLDNFTVSTWPESDRTLLEVAAERPVYWRSGRALDGLLVATTAATQPIYLEDTHIRLSMAAGTRVYARDYNVENNYYNILGRPSVTYVTNDGGRFWCLGMKTEAMALHVQTTNGGVTELLGGFFRDHNQGRDADTAIPYFRTIDAAISASYVKYNWNGCGDGSRLNEAIETRGAQTRTLSLDRCNTRVDLYAGYTSASVPTTGTQHAMPAFQLMQSGARRLALSLARGSEAQVAVFDSRGRHVWECEVSGAARRVQSVALPALVPGVYQVRATAPGVASSCALLIRK